jgi:hypothetical protein
VDPFESAKDIAREAAEDVVRARLARSKGQPAYPTVLPPVTGPFTGTVEPSEEETISSGYRPPGAIPLDYAEQIVLGEREDPGGYITPRSYLNLKLAQVTTLGQRMKRAREAKQSFVDEGGNIVGPGGRPLATDEELNSLGLEVAGYGVGVGQAGKYGLTLTQKLTNFLRQKMRREATKAEADAFIKNFVKRMSETKKSLPIGDPEDVARQMEIEGLVKGTAVGPTRVIEAPPAPGKVGTGSTLVRNRILREQQEAVGDLGLTDPAARVVMEPAMRGEGGRVIIPPRERVPIPVEEAGPVRREVVKPPEKPPEPPSKPPVPPPTPTTRPDVPPPPPVQGPSPHPLEPYKIIQDVMDKRGAYTRAYERGEAWWREKSAQAKSALGLSTPIDISRVYPEYGELVEKTIEASKIIRNRADDLVAQRKMLVKSIGPDEFSRVMKLLDENKPLIGVTPDIASFATQFYQTMQEYAVSLPNKPFLKDGFHSRLKQSLILRGAKATDIGEYVTEDISRILPAERGKNLKARLAHPLTGDEPYTVDNIDRMIRAVARSSVLKVSPTSPGYLADIKPLLEVLKDKPDLIVKEVDGFVNYFIGAPGARSPQALQRWADRLRAIQYGSKIAGNITSPIWNAGQNFLTFAETDIKSFGKAWADIGKDWNARLTGGQRDPKLLDIIKRGGLEHELASTSILSDVGTLPTDLLNKFDVGVAKFNDVGGMGFRFVERHNRLAAFLSGYNDAIARGLDDAAAIVNGKKVMAKTQFTGGEVDIPKLFRKAGMGTAGQFKTFVLKYGEYMKDNAADAAKALVDPRLSPEERIHNLKKFGKFWGSQIAMGGTAVVPGVPFVLGDWLKEQPEVVQHGLGAMIDIDLGRQFGIGVLPVEKLTDFLYNVPGPTLNTAQDIAAIMSGRHTGAGLDFTGAGRDLTWDEWERKLVRLAPAGVQTARILEAIKTFRNEGEKRKALTPREAFALEAPSGRMMSEVTADWVRELIGFREPRRERERDITAAAREEEAIDRKARMDAAELYNAGKYTEAQVVLQKASKKLGREIFMSPSNIESAYESRYKTATEKLRERRARQGIVIPKP